MPDDLWPNQRNVFRTIDSCSVVVLTVVQNLLLERWRVAEQPAHHSRRVPITLTTTHTLNRLPDLGHLIRAQRHIRGCRILLQVLHTLRAWDGNEVISLRKYPRKDQLSRADALLLCNLREQLYELQIVAKVLLIETWVVCSRISRVEIRAALDRVRQESTTLYSKSAGAP